jgi:putative transposase
MARPLRVEYPNAFYHAISRGNGGQLIFQTDRDKEKFLAILQKAVDRYSLRVHTYCLMANHYHLLLETPEANLSSAMQWLNVSYACYFNKRHGHNGHLFQGRFKAILIDGETYLQQLSRYIHLNPVRAELVSTPADYRWSSYRALIGEISPPSFLTADWLLSSFGSQKKRGMKRYKEFVESGNIEPMVDPHKDMEGGFILGGKAFVNWVRQTFLADRADEREIPQLRSLKPRVLPEKVVQEVCREFGCSEGGVRAKGRKKNRAREMAIYLARGLSGQTCSQLGAYFGGVSGALITMMANRIAKQEIADKALALSIERVKKRIFNI